MVLLARGYLEAGSYEFQMLTIEIPRNPFEAVNVRAEGQERQDPVGVITTSGEPVKDFLSYRKDYY